MEYEFSQELRNDTKDYFSPRYGRPVTDEEADEYLKSLCELADFFLAPDINESTT